jgi:hypothetical protein
MEQFSLKPPPVSCVSHLVQALGVSRFSSLYAVLVERHGTGTPWALGDLTSSQLASFYRWMLFIPGNIYPLITLMGRRNRPAPFPNDSPILRIPRTVP